MTTRKYSFINKSGEVYPAFGCGRLSNVLEVDAAGSQPIYELVKPDGEDGIYVVNGPNNVANNKPGVALALIDAFLVLIDDGSTDGAPVFGDTCGPTEERWAATTAGTGLKASGNDANRVIPVVSVPGSGSSGSGNPCDCKCIEHGDIFVNGIETTSVWQVPMSQQIFEQEFGKIILPAGLYYVIYNPATEEWVNDIGGYLTAEYLGGEDATEDTTMDGAIVMSFDSYGVPKVTLCVEGTVPDPEEE